MRLELRVWNRRDRTGWLRVVVASLGLLAGLACSGTPPDPDPATRRAIAQGEIVGAAVEEGRAHAWRGLPFAAPPVGALRWRAPRAPAAWEGVREALVSGSACPQLGGEPTKGEEDCLYLDVFAPVLDGAALPEGPDRKPVMVWIHGGGNTMGQGDMVPVSRLAAEHDVLVVTINYRLGIFGWFSHPALRASAETFDDASGNFGTLDVVRALEWVQQNIAAFGGDPDRVTLFGESAGGINVFSMLLSPRAKGLFHRAIAQSGGPVSMTRVQAERYTDAKPAGLPGNPSELLLALLRKHGRAEDRASAKAVAEAMSAEEIEAFLRGFDAESLLEPYAERMGDAGLPIYLVPTIVRDGHVIPDEDPLALFSSADGYNAVPFISGANREETKLFHAFDSPHVRYLFGLPRGFENERLYDVEGEYGGLFWRAMAVDAPLSRMRRAQGPSVWGYRFDWDEEPAVLGLDLSKLLGAAHAMEMLFVFGLTDLGFANRFVFDDVESAETLSRAMRTAWTDFARDGRPGPLETGGGTIEWPAWSPEPKGPRYLIFDSERDGGLELGADEIDSAFLLSRVRQDPRLLNAGERCGVYRNLMSLSDVLTLEQYDSIDEGACRAFPVDSRFLFPSLDHWSDAEAS